MDDDEAAEIERLLEILRARCDAATDQQAREILANIDTVAPVEIGEGQVVLLGWEDQVDHVIRVPDPLPHDLLVPLPQRLRSLEAWDEAEALVSMPVARYERRGEFTYQRTH